MRILFWRPTPAPPGMFKGQPLPYKNSNLISKFFINWVSPIMKVAWSRNIEADDLYDLTPDLQSHELGNILEAAFMARLPPSLRSGAYRPAVNGQTNAPRDGAPPFLHGSNETHAEHVRLFGKRQANKIRDGRLIVESGKAYDQSLFKALYSVVWKQFWWVTFLRAMAIFMRLLTPILIKELIRQLTRARTWNEALKSSSSVTGLIPPRSVGSMIGTGIGIWAMLLTASCLLYYGFWRANLTGRKLVTAISSLISRKAMRLSGKARIEMDSGRLNTMLSVDAALLVKACRDASEITNIPLQLILGVGPLIWQLGYSALVGLGVLCLSVPFKAWMYKRVSRLRKEQNKVIDVRVRLLSEILTNIRAVKLYAYEAWFGKKIGEMRSKELAKFRSNILSRSILTSTMTLIPTLAAILTFITYSLSGHELDAAIVFSSLQYFNVLRVPISYAPEVLTNLGEGAVAIRRIGDLLRAEEIKQSININPCAPHAIDVKGDFQFETVHSGSIPAETAKGVSKTKQGDDTPRNDKEKTHVEAKASEKNDSAFPEGDSNTKAIVGDAEKRDKNGEEGEPFALRDLNLQIPRGSLVCVVGRVGTGKTALLSGLINEMKQTKGHVTFGGSVSYVPQHAWVQSGSIRENITFSAEPGDVKLDRVQKIIDACGLRPDIDMWPDGDLTMIGERGITLSGGQRQRICIARAAYEKSDIVLLDDPLSAVDAHVGHHLMERCILHGPMEGRTRVLVTHQLDVLPRADLVLVMGRDGHGDGKVIQQGTYEDLLNEEGTFRSLIEQYGSAAASSQGPDDEERGALDAVAGMKVDIGSHNPDRGIHPTEVSDEAESKGGDKAERGVQKELVQGGGAKLIIDEEKAEGAVSSTVYLNYGKSIKSLFIPIMCGTFLVMSQSSTVLNTLFLGYWSEDHFANLSQGAYMGIYGGLGVAMALFAWSASYTLFVAALRASYTMFNEAWTGVMRSPTIWHDRTPTGRIISRLSKDVELLDDRMASIWYNVLSGVLIIVGAIGLILYNYPWVGLFFIPILIFDFLTVIYYRQTSREIQRLGSLLRSNVYSNFSEQLSGLSVIRAFRQQERFIRKFEGSVDVHFSAYMVSNYSQGPWLGLRLSFGSQLLVLIVAMFGIIMRHDVSSAKFGVALTYIILSTSTLNALVGWVTEAEQEMNTVERVQYYSTLAPEASPYLPSDPKDGEPWPTAGAVSFQDVEMRYRPDLPLALKGVNFEIKPGEKVGVIGRTGAGKSSIAQSLFRTVEICSGKIEVDGRDLKEMGLDTLRQRLAIIPQDAFLFGGSVRENIDPTCCKTDAELNEALGLINRDNHASSSLREKFRLDAVVANEGSNFSAGERQLLALVRALVKGSKVLLLDEATSSVDPETDALIQRIIQTEFSDITLISIAHRLQTVAYYDRILVMDNGHVSEFDAPLVLFDQPDSIFRSLCDKKNLGREVLVRIREDAVLAQPPFPLSRP